MDQTTESQAADIRRAAAVRRDYVLWLAKALEQRACRGPGGGDMCSHDRDLMMAAAGELRALVEP